MSESICDFVIIGSFQTESTEIRTILADVPTSEAQVFLLELSIYEYSIDHHDGRFRRSNFGPTIGSLSRNSGRSSR